MRALALRYMCCVLCSRLCGVPMSCGCSRRDACVMSACVNMLASTIRSCRQDDERIRKAPYIVGRSWFAVGGRLSAYVDRHSAIALLSAARRLISA